MLYKTIFSALAFGLATMMTAVVLMHDRIPRWEGWIGIGGALLAVAMMGLAKSRSPARHA